MSLLRQDMRLPESSIHDFGRDLVISIQYLHSNAIIYCDLKPSNILLDENGRIKLGGFGLSRRLSDINKTSLQQLPPVRLSPGSSNNCHASSNNCHGSANNCHGSSNDCHGSCNSFHGSSNSCHGSSNNCKGMSRACIPSTCGMIAVACVELANTIHVAPSWPTVTSDTSGKAQLHSAQHQCPNKNISAAAMKRSITAFACSTLTDTKWYRQSVAPHATWLQSCSRMGLHTPVQQICGPLGACCMSALLATPPLSAPPSTTLSMTSSLERLRTCQVSWHFPFSRTPALQLECVYRGNFQG